MNGLLNEKQRDRYSRQLMVDMVGDAEQASLLESSALVVGAGGLGAAVIQYLAAAGVGTLGIVDDGTVKRSNLQRQVIYGVDDLGEPKVERAARFVEALNPDVDVERHRIRIDPDVDETIIERYDVIVDGLDNFPGRFVVNDLARLSNVPFVHGGVYGFEGQMTTFRSGGPCYRCLVPEAPDQDSIPSGEPMGVFSPLPGTIGCLQATEALKLLSDVGTPISELLRYDALDVEFIRTPIEPDPACPICGSDAVDSFDEIEYDDRYRIRR